MPAEVAENATHQAEEQEVEELRKEVEELTDVLQMRNEIAVLQVQILT
jgi:hypothetical protein